MTTTIESANKITVKLFTGYHLNSEIKMHLKQSLNWKQAAISPIKEGEELIEVHYHDKDYLGYYLSTDKITLSELKKAEDFLKQRLTSYCAEYSLENIKICIFAQVFVA